jgi:hypothetical protein
MRLPRLCGGEGSLLRARSQETFDTGGIRFDSAPAQKMKTKVSKVRTDNLVASIKNWPV